MPVKNFFPRGRGAGATTEVLSGEEGQCTGQNDLFCDVFVKGNGEGIITCATNADCDAVFGVDGAGDCGLSVVRKCFLDPIDAVGTPGTEGAVLVSTFCSAPTSSGAVNSAAGTPGPSRLSLDFEFFGRCADGSEPIDLVTGNNFNDFTDFVSGRLFEWRRHYTTGRAHVDGPLGFGFRHFYQRTLEVRLHQSTFVDWDCARRRTRSRRGA